MVKSHIYRHKFKFEAFQYNGEYSSACPQWAQSTIAKYKKDLNTLMGMYLIKGVDGKCSIFPKDGFENLFEIVPEENNVVPFTPRYAPEGIEDPKDIA